MCDIQIKTIVQYLHVVLFSVLYMAVLSFKSEDETLVCDPSMQMKAGEQFFHAVQFVM